VQTILNADGLGKPVVYGNAFLPRSIWHNPANVCSHSMEENLMKLRPLGALLVSPLAIGTGRLASWGAGYSTADVRRLLDAGYEAGVNFIDTADSYGSAECEKMLGHLLAGHRGHFRVSTKCGYPFADFPGPLAVLNQPFKKVMQYARMPQRFDPAYLDGCITGSLRRLRLETLDIFLLHDPPSTVWNQSGVIDALERRKAAGDVTLFGVSSDRIALLIEAARQPLFEVFQTRVNPLVAAPGHLDPLVQARGAGCVMANHVQGGGRLAADASGRLQTLAESAGRSVRSLLVSYAAGLNGVSTVISGTGRPSHLLENLRAACAPLSPAQMANVSDLLSKNHLPAAPE